MGCSTDAPVGCRRRCAMDLDLEVTRELREMAQAGQRPTSLLACLLERVEGTASGPLLALRRGRERGRYTRPARCRRASISPIAHATAGSIRLRALSVPKTTAPTLTRKGIPVEAAICPDSQ
jgi:hypothetical protein